MRHETPEEYGNAQRQHAKRGIPNREALDIMKHTERMRPRYENVQGNKWLYRTVTDVQRRRWSTHFVHDPHHPLREELCLLLTSISNVLCPWDDDGGKRTAVGQ